MHGLWLYALLAKLEKPVHRDMCAILRQLLRICSHARAQLLPDALDFNQKLASLNIFLLISGSYFGQGEEYDSRQHNDNYNSNNNDVNNVNIVNHQISDKDNGNDEINLLEGPSSQSIVDEEEEDDDEVVNSFNKRDINLEDGEELEN
jgi:hypothetical protein